MKKPRLTVVPTKPNPLAPPPSLGQAGAALWSRIQGAYRCDDPPGAAMLEEICGAADRSVPAANIEISCQRCAKATDSKAAGAAKTGSFALAPQTMPRTTGKTASLGIRTGSTCRSGFIPAAFRGHTRTTRSD